MDVRQIVSSSEKSPTCIYFRTRACEATQEKIIRKEVQGFFRIVKRKDIRDNQPKHFRISPILMISHKYHQHQETLNISYQLQVGHSILPLINNAFKRLTPPKVIDQVGNTIRWLIEGIAGSPDSNILFSKLNIKDSYWRMNVEQHKK